MASFKNLISTTADSISSGGTITGDLTISGDLTVTGSGGAVYDEIIEGSLHIKTAATGGTIADLSYADDLVIEDDGGAGISIRTPDANSGNIVFQVPSNDTVARILADYGSGSEYLAIEVDGSERLRIDSSGNVGIGTETIPHGGVGYAKLAIDGTNTSSAGPHVQYTTASDDYPLFQQLNWGHDSVHMLFDSYFDGDWKSSDAGSNFKIGKSSDKFIISYDSGISAGSAVTFNDGIVLDTSGYVGIGTTVPKVKFVASDGSLSTTDPVTGTTVVGLFASANDAIDGGSGGQLMVQSTDAQAIDKGGMLSFGGERQDSQSGALPWCAIAGRKENGTTTNYAAYLQFATRANGGAITEQMRIDSAGKVGIGTDSPDTICHIESANPYLTLENSSTEDGDTGRESQVRFQGRQSGGEVSVLAKIQGSHDGSSDDEKGHLLFYTNSGGSEAIRFKIDSDSRISLSNNDSGTSNTIFGKGAAANLDDGSNYNTFIGWEVSDASMNDATYNTGVGYRTFKNLTEGDNNVAIGADAGLSITTGTGNVVVGQAAADALTTGADNVAIGRIALGTSVAGMNDNIAIGANSMGNANNSSSVGNISIGTNALDAIGTNAHTGTIAIGHQALTALTSGAGNVAVGYQAADGILTGAQNTAIGYQALTAANGSESKNTAVGNLALTSFDADGDNNNTAIGYGAGASLSTGEDNTIVGSGALIGLQTGAGNIAIGSGAFDAAALDESNNVAIGYDAMGACDQGSHVSADIDRNVCVGRNAGFGGDFGSSDLNFIDNVAVGDGAMDATGAYQAYDNTAVGANAMGGSWVATAYYNTAIGSSALVGALNTATENVAVGANAGTSITTGDQNTIIGTSVATSGSASQNQSVIGYGATGVADNSVTLGNASVTDVYMAQDSGAYVHSQNVPNHVANTMSAPYYRFDGSNDDIEIADSAHLSFGGTTYDTPFSISAWINMEDATNFRIVSKGTYNSDMEYLFTGNGSDKLALEIYDESVADTYEVAATTAALTDYEGKWIHVCGTYNGVGGTSANAGITLYINGVSQALTLAGNGTYVAMENLTDEVRIGNYADTQYAQGSIAGIQIFNLELSAAEVKELYSGASVPFKYKGANQTDNFGGYNLSSGWATSNATIDSSTQFTVDSTGGYIRAATSTTAGKRHMIHIIGTQQSGQSFAVLDYDGNDDLVTYGDSTSSTITGTSFDERFEWTGQSNGYQFKGIAGTGQIQITTLKTTLIGAVAEYDGSGIASDKWFDKSGNDLHGTVSGATVENAPAGDDGLIYEEGTWTPGFEGAVANPTSVVWSEQTGNYVRIGRLVTASFYWRPQSWTGGSGNLKITGLPFTIDGAVVSGNAMTNNLDYPTGTTIAFNFGDGNAFFYVHMSGDDIAWDPVEVSNVAAYDIIQGTITYYA